MTLIVSVKWYAVLVALGEPSAFIFAFFRVLLSAAPCVVFPAAALFFVRVVLIVTATSRASAKLHDDMFNSLVRRRGSLASNLTVRVCVLASRSASVFRRDPVGSCDKPQWKRSGNRGFLITRRRSGYLLLYGLSAWHRRFGHGKHHLFHPFLFLSFNSLSLPFVVYRPHCGCSHSFYRRFLRVPCFRLNRHAQIVHYCADGCSSCTCEHRDN